MKKVREEPLEVAIRGNHIIKGPYRLHKNREEFFEYFDRMDFTSLTKGCYYNQIYKYYKQGTGQKITGKLIMNIIILQRRRQGIAMEEKLLHGYNPANLKKY